MNEHERMYLSAALANPSVLDDFPLTEACFSGDYRRAFHVMSELHEKGEDIDLLILTDRGVRPSTAATLDLSGVNIGYHAQKLRDGALSEELRRIALRMQDFEGTPEELLEFVEQRVSAISASASHGIISMERIVFAGVKEIEERVKSEGAIRGLTCGLRAMDERIQGLKPGQLVVIAARTSIGKTALAMTMAMHQALAGIHVGFIEMEQSREELGMRWLTMASRSNLMQVQSGMMTPTRLSEITDAASRLYNTKVQVDDTPNQPLNELRASARHMVRRGAQVIYVDYLGLVGYGPPGMGMYERVGTVVKELKGLARELNVPLIVLGQLNRQAEGERPGLHHLAESGQIEQHADIIVLLHRERDADATEGIIAKGRNIECRSFDLRFNGPSVMFEDLS